MRLRLASTHPIQYQVPWFRALAARERLDFEVGFAALPGAAEQGVGFEVPFEWDVPLLDGYRWRELPRRRRGARLGSFFGLRLRRPGSWLAPPPDALVLTGWNSWALVQLALAAKRRGIPVIARGDSRAVRRGLATRIAHRALLRLYSAFLVVGESNREFYRSYGVAPEKLFDCPHFVDNDRFAAASTAARADRGALRAGWGVPATSLCVLFAGKLAPVKNLSLLLESLDRARREEPELHLLIAGEGPLRAELERAVLARSLPVSFTGFLNQSEMPRAYAAADLLVLPSHSESWGLVVNEAMASGLPAIVSSAVGCAPDLVAEDQTGWVFPAEDSAALASRLVLAARAREQLGAMGAEAQRRVKERYSVERAVEGTLAALASVAGERRSG
jgi:glycosyltransferase involved in cell wall biosynthesis